MINPIERLWGVMHRRVTPNKCHATFARFTTAMLAFPARKVPKNWPCLRASVADNFRVIDPKDIRVVA